jgi:hypothetical protein
MAKMTTLHLRCTCVASPVALLLATQKPVALHTVSLRHVCGTGRSVAPFTLHFSLERNHCGTLHLQRGKEGKGTEK